MAEVLNAAWFDAQLEGAPAELVARTREFARLDEGVELTAVSLAEAGRVALAAAVAGSPDRRAALDLLAADALVTLALAAQVESGAPDLERFAAKLRIEGEPAE